MTNEEKCGIIARAIGSRKGRIKLGASMAKPIGGSGKVPCDVCALRRGDCEKCRIHVTGTNSCCVPDGFVFVYDEVAV